MMAIPQLMLTNHNCDYVQQITSTVNVAESSTTTNKAPQSRRCTDDCVKLLPQLASHF